MKKKKFTQLTVLNIPNGKATSNEGLLAKGTLQRLKVAHGISER